jgi:hypothetical protein
MAGVAAFGESPAGKALEHIIHRAEVSIATPSVGLFQPGSPAEATYLSVFEIDGCPRHPDEELIEASGRSFEDNASFAAT